MSAALTREVETPGGVELRVRTAAGAVEVHAGASGRTEVEVEPHNRAAEEVMDRVRIDTRETSAGVRVDVETPDREGFGSSGFGFLLGRGDPQFLVRIRCPEGARLELESRSADLSARGRLGILGVRTASGDVEVETVAGDVEVGSASGDVDLGDVGGRLSVTTASGDFSVGHVGGPLNANLVSGDLDVRDAADTVDAKTVSGDLNIERASGRSVSLRSVSGDVSVALRRGASVWLDVRSLSGDTTSELEPEDGPAAEGPSVELRINTVSGDIHISRAAGDPHPA